MKNIFNKIKRKWINIDINKKSRILTISLLILLLISSGVILTTNGFFAKAATLTVGSNTINGGSDGRAVGDAVLNAANATYYLDGVGDVFCIEPGIAADTGLDYTELPSVDLKQVEYRTASGHKSVDVTDSMKEYWSLISYYYENNKNMNVRAAAQMLVWEVSTGGRTNFSSEQPDGFNAEGSYWAKRVNGKTTDLANAYRSIVEFVSSYYQNPLGTSTNEEENRYTLSYSGSKYETTIESDSNISEYSCSSENSAISINISGSTIKVTSDSFLSDYATITCTRGSSIGGQFFQYPNYQKVVHGNLTPAKVIKFQVKTDGFPVSIKKYDEYNNPLGGAVFTVSNGIDTYEIKGNDDNVIIKKPGSYTIEETTVPEGYQKMETKTIEITGSKEFSFNDIPLQIQFQKVDSETKKVITENIGFTIYKNIGNTKTKVKLIDKDVNTGCYTESSKGSTEVVLVPNSDGNICVRRVTSGATYIVEETTVPVGYQKMGDITITAPTFDGDSEKTVYENVTNNPLKIKFYKEDSETKQRINNAGFKVYKGSTLVKFDSRDSNGCYKENTSGKVSEVFTDTTINNGEICLSYVTSKAEYTIKETTVPTGYKKMADATITATDKNNIATNISEMGLINYPTKFEFTKAVDDDTANVDSSITELIDIAKFTITNANDTTPLRFIDKGNGEYWYNENGTVTLLNTTNRKFIVKYLPVGNYVIKENTAVNGYYLDKDGATFTITNESSSELTSATIINKLVKINFEKTDIYKYYTSDDIAKLNSNEKLLDTAKFVLKDSNGNILSLKKISDGIYRYLPVNSNNTINEINTYNGKFIITHLSNNTSYTIEEIKSPEGFILPEEHPKVVYNIKEEKPESDKDSSITQVIENIPTKVKIEKRDLKTGNLIKDEEEKTTFELYKLESDGSRKRIYVTERVPIIDASGNVEYSYRYSKLNEKTNVPIKLTNGYIIFRYLPKGNYVFVETEAPEGYDLPVGISSETTFEVSNTTTESEIEVIKNKPSKIILKKYSEDGLLLSGARFKLYKVNKDNYDDNLSIKNNALLHGEVLTLKTIRDGEYEYKNEKDTEVITTCIKDCSLIGKETGDAGTIESGMLQVEYLDTENYYIFEEIEAPSGYTLPEDPYTLVYLPESVDGENISIEIENKYTPVTFYKYDEYNNLLDGAVYKLQKLNSNKKYEDVTVSKMEEKEGSVYLIDFNTDNVDITTTDGRTI